MTQAISRETILAARRQGTYETEVPFLLNGKVESVKKRIVNGEMETHVLSRPIGELITSSGLEQHRDLLRKVVLDVELGREFQPVVYQPIYETIVDPNFPRVTDAKWALMGRVVFTEHLEGQEVRFGTLDAAAGPTARILTFTAAFEYTREIVDFNETFRVELLNRNLGEAHNALLNHMHLQPIFGFSYTSPNITTWIAPPAGQPRWVGIYNTLVQAQQDMVRARRPGSVLLAHPVLQAEIELVLRGGHNLGGTAYPPLAGIQQAIYYAADDLFGYPSPAENRIYFIRPRRGFKELVKQDLRIEAQMGDLSRLIQEQLVAYAHRGVYAAVGENVQQVNIG